jgi:hypothetical protein
LDAVPKGFAEPEPRDIDHRSSKLALDPVAGFVCVLSVVPGRFDAVEEVGFMRLVPLKKVGV